MSGVFLSYSRGDRALAEQIIQGLRALGVDVWWDEDMPGVDWQEELERQISGLAGVLVLWTPNSSASKNVRDEARLGLKSEKLINVLVGRPSRPSFDRVNGLPLDGWTGREPHHGWGRVVQTIEALIVRAGGAMPGEIMAVLAKRDRSLRLARTNVEDAEHAFQDAQLHEAETAEAANAASAAVVQAESQLQRMVEMRVSSAVMRTAQQELDDAQDVKAVASQAQRTAKAALSEASRVLARTRTALDRLVADSAPAPISTPAPVEAPSPAEPVETAAPEVVAEQPMPSHSETVSRSDDEPVFPRPSSPAASLADQPGRPAPSSAPANMAAGITLGVILLIAALVGVVVLSARRHTDALDSAAAVESAAGAASAAAAPAVAANGTPNPGIGGNWTLQNVSCNHAIRIAIDGDTISIAGSKMKIASVDADGTVNAGPSDARYNIEVSGDSLTVTSPSTDQASYTRCAG